MQLSGGLLFSNNEGLGATESRELFDQLTISVLMVLLHEVS
jgi:hypothetical protein